MYNIIFPFYAVWLYMVSSYYDFNNNKEAYVKELDFFKIKIIFYNVFIFLPLSTWSILTYQPIIVEYYSYDIEILHLVINIFIGEIWFYTFHRLLHTKYLYKYHKQHHEIKNTIGILALYAHPFDAIIVNLGSIYFLHIILKFSLLQLFIVGTYATCNTIIESHSSIHKQNIHQIHHTKFNVNYGFNLFMDKIFKTAYDIQFK